MLHAGAGHDPILLNGDHEAVTKFDTTAPFQILYIPLLIQEGNT